MSKKSAIYQGKSKKLTPSVLESKTPIGVYLEVFSNGNLLIGNHTTHCTFYSGDWEYQRIETGIEESIRNFINNSPNGHLQQMEEFRQAQRKNISYKAGDFFTFKLNRTEFGFGRILFDVHKARQKKLLPEKHGLNLLMGPPLLVKLYAYKSNTKKVDIQFLKKQNSLPSDFIMDNLIFYGDFEIIGNLPLEVFEFEFPISYGMRIDGTSKVFLQWGLIHKELPKSEFNKYIMLENGRFGEHNPYGYYGIGFRPNYDIHDIILAIENNGVFDFTKSVNYAVKFDLRNPQNKTIRIEIFKAFGLDPNKDYWENCKLEGTKDIIELIKEMR